jgi:hypothetical protein
LPSTCAMRCFVAGTLVATLAGATPIEEVKIGDQVLALNQETQQVELADVVRLFEREAPETWILTIEGGSQVETTAEHPFFVEGKGFTRVDQLQVGDQLRTSEGERLVLAGIEVKAAPKQVFNFEVADRHNYYVGTQQVLVHNCDSIVLGQNMPDRVIPAAEAIGSKWLDVPGPDWTWAKNRRFLYENVNKVIQGKGRIFDIGGQRGRYQGPNAIYTKEKVYLKKHGLVRVNTGKWIQGINGRKFRLYEWVASGAPGI